MGIGSPLLPPAQLEEEGGWEAATAPDVHLAAYESTKAEAIWSLPSYTPSPCPFETEVNLRLLLCPYDD